MPFHKDEIREFTSKYSSLSEGNTIRDNHQSDYCSGSSNSMIITRSKEGELTIKCFRCDSWCKLRDDDSFVPKSKKSGSTESNTNDESKDTTSGVGDSSVGLQRIFDEYSRATEEISRWSPAAICWHRRYGITDKEVLSYGFKYNSFTGNLLIPLYDCANNIVGVQIRNLSDSSTSPKYKTHCIYPPCIILGADRNSSSRIVLVEDILSGIKCSRYMTTLVLLGTELREHHVEQLIKQGFNDFYIFLDDDNNIVKGKQRKIHNTLSKLGKSRIIRSGGIDPKEHSVDALMEILK